LTLKQPAQLCGALPPECLAPPERLLRAAPTAVCWVCSHSPPVACMLALKHLLLQVHA